MSSSSSEDESAYNIDTDVEESTNDGRPNQKKPVCVNDFFKNFHFFLHPTNPLRPEQRKQIEKTINRHKG